MVALRNTTDVQMFLLWKQTKQRLFFSGQRDCQNKSWGPFGPLASTNEVTMCSILLCLRVVLNLVLDAVCFMCVRVCLLPVIVLECRGGSLWMMNWRKTCSEHSPILPPSPMIYTLPLTGSILAPQGIAGPKGKTSVRQEWNERRAKHEKKVSVIAFCMLCARCLSYSFLIKWHELLSPHA